MYKFPQKLYQGTLIKRYKRFFADVSLASGEIITAHCPNTGAMTSCIQPGCDVWVSKHNNPKRKLQYTLELTRGDFDQIVCVNTQVANRFVANVLESRTLSFLPADTEIKREFAFGQSKIDFALLSNGSPQALIEVKSATLSEHKGCASFPDTKTQRGLKHILELASFIDTFQKDESQELSKKQAHLFFLVLRDEITSFYPALNCDAKYTDALRQAHAKGLKISILFTSISSEGIELREVVHTTV